MSKSTARMTLAAVSAFAALALAGAAQAAPDTVVISAQQADAVYITSHSGRDEVAGGYRMSDGRLLTVQRRGNGVVAELDGLPVTRLSPSGATTLSSEDKRMVMRFNRDRDEGLVVTLSLAVEGGQAVLLSSRQYAQR